jgi:hypothetical protein
MPLHFRNASAASDPIIFQFYSIVVICLILYSVLSIGYINILRLSSKDLHMKNTQNDSQAMIIDPAKLSK